MPTDPIYPITDEPAVHFSEADREKLATKPSHSGPDSAAIADLLTLLEIDAHQHGACSVAPRFIFPSGYSPVQQRKRVLDYVRALMEQRDTLRTAIESAIASGDVTLEGGGAVVWHAMDDIMDDLRAATRKAK